MIEVERSVGHALDFVAAIAADAPAPQLPVEPQHDLDVVGLVLADVLIAVAHGSCLSSENDIINVYGKVNRQYQKETGTP